VDAPITIKNAAVVWTGQELVVYGGALDDMAWNGPNLGARYNPTTDKWRSMTPSPYFDHTMILRGVWTGSDVILAGNNYYNGGSYDFGVTLARYDMTTDSWDALPRPACEFGVLTWTGSQ